MLNIKNWGAFSSRVPFYSGAPLSQSNSALRNREPNLVLLANNPVICYT